MKLITHAKTILQLGKLCSHRYKISGDSMSPTLLSGQQVLTIWDSNSLSSLTRADIIILQNPDGSYIDSKHLAKRIIGLPGEKICLCKSDTYADGSKINESYLAPYHENWTITGDSVEWCLKDDEYFVLSDHRPDGIDSRKFGPISSKQIIGKVCLSWSFSIRPLKFTIRYH